MSDVERATDAARAAAYRLDARVSALRATCSRERLELLERLLDAATDLQRAESERLVAELVAGIGPALRDVADRVIVPNY